MSPDARAVLDPLQEPEGWTLTDRVDAFVAGTVLALGCFAGGFQLGQWIESRKPAPAPEIVYRAPLTQWDCSDQEFREHLHACTQRQRSSAVKPNSMRKSL
jgi:hypothetical protein